MCMNTSNNLKDISTLPHSHFDETENLMILLLIYKHISYNTKNFFIQTFLGYVQKP